MKTHELSAMSRTERGRSTYALRIQDKIPAVVYGAMKEPKMVSVDYGEFVRIYKEAGESSLVTLKLEDGSTLNVLIQDIQTDPLRDDVIHADFRAVDMTKPIEADVTVVFAGESGAVKNLGGTLVQALPRLTVRALPANLPHELVVDLSKLATFEDAIHVSDVKAPEGVEIMHEMEETIAAVQAPRSEEEMASLENAVDIDVTTVEVEKKGKEDEEAAADGEAAAPAADAKKDAAKK